MRAIIFGVTGQDGSYLSDLTHIVLKTSWTNSSEFSDDRPFCKKYDLSLGAKKSKRFEKAISSRSLLILTIIFESSKLFILICPIFPS